MKVAALQNDSPRVGQNRRHDMVLGDADSVSLPSMTSTRATAPYMDGAEVNSENITALDRILRYTQILAIVG